MNTTQLSNWAEHCASQELKENGFDMMLDNCVMLSPTIDPLAAKDAYEHYVSVICNERAKVMLVMVPVLITVIPSR